MWQSRGHDDAGEASFSGPRRVRVVLAGGERSAVARRAAAAGITQCWPDGETAPEFAHETTETGPGGRPGLDVLDAAGLLLWVDEAATPGGLRRMLDAAAMVDGPTVVLRPGGVSWEVSRMLNAAAREGVLVERVDAPCAQLALTLRALLLRQPGLRRMQHEAGMMQSSHRGVAVELTRIDEELRRAAALHRKLVCPPSAVQTGVRASVFSRPAGYLGGDVVDVRALGPHTLSFFFADAVGHGAAAALLSLYMACSLPRVRDTPDRLSLGRTPQAVPPDEALARLNHAFVSARLGTERFATAMYGLVDTRTMTVTVAGAGHPPPLLVRAGAHDERVERLSRIETEGPLLGVFADATFPSVTFRLGPRDAMLVFSDGFETAFPDEAPGDGLEPATDGGPAAREPRHIACLADVAARAHHDATLEEALGRLSSVLDDQAGSLHQSDDITALVLAPAAAVAAIAA